jgi:hypothetical protein
MVEPNEQKVELTPTEKSLEQVKHDYWIVEHGLSAAKSRLEIISTQLQSMQTKGLSRDDLISLIYGSHVSLGKRNVELVINALYQKNVNVMNFLGTFTKGVKAQEVYAVLADLQRLINKYETLAKEEKAKVQTSG